MKVLGLMSGTSMDGIDAALLEVRGEDPSAPEWTLRAFRPAPYGPERRRRLRTAVDDGGAEALCRLHADLGEWLAEAALGVLREAGVDTAEVTAVGSHGHTVWHVPPDGGRRGATLQLGDPATLAARCGVPVVSDFRTADVAAGGHGAPLVPWADRILFSRPGGSRALQNLGGVGNVTWLPPRGSAEDPVAFDTGPGNGLLDAAARRASSGGREMDVDGRRAAAGTVDAGLLDELMGHPFLTREPPRSTGREAFGPELVARLATERGLEPGGTPAAWDDLLATLTAFTARSVADAYRRWIVPRGVDEVVLTGGGARNPELVRRLREALAPLPVRTGEEALGMDPDAREAAAFALLAWAWVRGVPGNVPGVTGASGPRVLGSWTPAPGRALLPEDPEGSASARPGGTGAGGGFSASFRASSPGGVSPDGGSGASFRASSPGRVSTGGGSGPSSPSSSPGGAAPDGGSKAGRGNGGEGPSVRSGGALRSSGSGTTASGVGGPRSFRVGGRPSFRVGGRRSSGVGGTPSSGVGGTPSSGVGGTPSSGAGGTPAAGRSAPLREIR